MSGKLCGDVAIGKSRVSDGMSKLDVGTPACRQFDANSLQLQRSTTDTWLYHIGPAGLLCLEPALDGSRTPRLSAAQRSPLLSFDSGVLHPLLIPSPSPPPSLPSLSSLRLPSPSRTSLSSSPLPCCDVKLRYAGILPRTYNRDGVDSREGIDGSDPNDISKRQKLSDSPSSICPLSTVMDTKYDESKCSSEDRNLASTARTSPTIFQSASPTAPKLSPIHNANKEWEVRKVIGKEYVDGVLHYLVEWCPTLEPQHSLGHAEELVDEFESQLRAHRGTKSRRGGVGLKIKKQMALESDAFGAHQQKKRRGRPRKQK